jgi:hypothetical protein
MDNSANNVAIIMRNPGQLTAGLHTCLQLGQAALSLTLFVLRQDLSAVVEHGDWDLLAEAFEGKRYTNNLHQFEQYGFQYADLTEMAVRIKNSDLVIPF